MQARDREAKMATLSQQPAHLDAPEEGEREQEDDEEEGAGGQEVETRSSRCLLDIIVDGRCWARI